MRVMVNGRVASNGPSDCCWELRDGKVTVGRASQMTVVVAKLMWHGSSVALAFVFQPAGPLYCRAAFETHDRELAWGQFQVLVEECLLFNEDFQWSVVAAKDCPEYLVFVVGRRSRTCAGVVRAAAV